MTSPLLTAAPRSLEQASRDIALADARWHYCLHRNRLRDANAADDRRAAMHELSMMGACRHRIMRLKIGDAAYHRMGLAYRAQQRRRTILWNDGAELAKAGA